MTHDTAPTTPRVALFVTCLVNQYRPSAAFSAITLLEKAGYEVSVPKAQTCCGQPGYNNGLEHSARETAKSTIKMLEHVDFVVIPSGSCTGMIKKHYPTLLADDKSWNKRAKKLSDKTWELCQFLVEKGANTLTPHTQLKGHSITYQDSCSCKRELNNTAAPRALIRQTCTGASLVELNDTASCCGFGGTFSVKYPDISQRLVSDKITDIKQTNANIVVSADLGCLINIAGYEARQEQEHTQNNHTPYSHALDIRHIAEVLAGELSAPGMNTVSHQDKLRD